MEKNPVDFKCPKCNILMDRWGGGMAADYIERTFRCNKCGEIYYATYIVEYVGLEGRIEHFERLLGKEKVQKLEKSE